jgi:hypothetical protein
MSNAYTAENVAKLAQQILSQNTTSKWTGGLDPKKAASYMADDLAKSGITDISQVGRGENGIINKATGEKLQSGYGERTEGNLWSGSYEGKGNTGFGVQFDAKGSPVFYTQGASSNDLVNMLGDNKLLNAAAQIGAAYFGGPAGSAALNAAMGKDIGDIAKSALLSYAGGQAAGAVSGMEGITDVLGKTGTDIASKAAGSFVSNEGKFDLEKFLLSQGLSYGKNALTSSLDGFRMNPDDFTEGYFLPGGEGYVDPMSRTQGVTGSGYYDEITGRYIKDDLGGLTNPLGYETGNIDPNLEWEYNQTSPNVWTDKDGNSLDMSYLPNSQTALTGEEIMRNAGALPKVTGGTKTTTGKSGTDTSTKTTTPTTSQQSGSGQQAQLPSEDPYADIKLMEQLFGGDIDYKLRSLGADTQKKPASNSMDALAKLLRG